MQIIQNQEKFILNHPTAVAIGKFDGVHVGHKKLLSEILKQKEQEPISLPFQWLVF